MLRCVFFICLGSLGLPLNGIAWAAEPAVDFERDVRPIFASRCAKCHGPEKSQGGLRLDRREPAFGPTDSGTAAIVPGKADESELLRRVTSEDDADRMPPDGDPLTVNEVATLRAWIAAGAAWPVDKTETKHWAWTAPVRPELPHIADAAWARNPIDRFVLAKLEREGLQPSPEADPAVLCRRLYLDLTGLPPTPEEVEAFVLAYSITPSLPHSADRVIELGSWGVMEREQAYNALVDKLFASPHFGERWARHWLDLARYADSNGFQRDGFRTMWAYRDWVVRAFNEDKPYPRFVLEQLAGDLLPNATFDDKIATGFNRCTTVNVEAGTDPEENRVLAVVDRVNTMATVFLGTTLACAQCHNHKYDPFTQVDYYRLLAYFNNTAAEITSKGSRRDFTGPSLELPMSDEQSTRRKSLEEQLQQLEARLAERTAAVGEMERELVHQVKSASTATPAWQVLAPRNFESSGGATPVTLPDNSVLLTEDRPEKDVYTITVHTKLANITGFRIEALLDDSLPGKGPGRGDAERPNFVLTEFAVQAAPEDDPTAKVDVPLADASADYEQAGYDAARAIDGQLNRGGWAINPRFHEPHWAVFHTRKPLGDDRGTILTFRLYQNYGTSRTIGRVRLSAMTGASEAAPFPPDVAAVLAKAVDKRTKAETKTLQEYCLALDPVAQQTRDSMNKVQGALKSLQSPTTLVMVELDQPRMTNVMKRGNFLDLGPQVKPGTPAALHPAADDAPPNRLGLAQWIVDDRNPLLARVAVNRWWAELFGRGLVATQEDFGTQCEPPTHPELLDWLAVELSKNGWSMKQTLKTIVTSATYRQSSSVTAALAKRDPYNLLYARGARFRLPAETIRDNALAASGLLSRKQGGPPVYPPQPEGIWRVTGEVDNNYYTSTGEDRYRRGLYTIWRRSAPYPSFVNFDAPERSACVVARPRTNTPLQALTLMNDPVFVEMAGALARRMAVETKSADPSAKIERGFRLLLARAPRANEAELLAAAYAAELAVYRADEAKTAKVLASAKLEASEAKAAELAALLHVATLLLNLDEAITKE
jgi:mono/diheme cytochrome c family protein